MSINPVPAEMPRTNSNLSWILNAALNDEGLEATWVREEGAVVITGGSRLVWARIGGSAPHVANVAVALAGPGSSWSVFYALPEAVAAVARLADPA